MNDDRLKPRGSEDATGPGPAPFWGDEPSALSEQFLGKFDPGFRRNWSTSRSSGLPVLETVPKYRFRQRVDDFPPIAELIPRSGKARKEHSAGFHIKGARKTRHSVTRAESRK